VLSAMIPAVIVVTYALQSTMRYWRAPNPYRFSIWLIGVFLMGGILILCYVPTLAQIVPQSFSPVVRLASHQLFNGCLMLSGYFASSYHSDIMEGWRSPRSRRQKRLFLVYLLATLVVMTVFFVRAISDGERETPSWFAADPARNGNLIIVSSVCLVYMCVVYYQIARFTARFTRITPVPSFKTGGSCFLLACCLGWISSFLAFCGLFVPAYSPLASVLESVIFANIGLLLCAFYLAGRLVDNPGKRLRRFGERFWSMVTIVRLYSLWRVVTTTIPEVVPPFRMPWLAAMFRNKVELLRDARIIEILDALHRLDLTLWNEGSQHAWLISMQQVVNTPLREGHSPHQQVQHIEQLAQQDAARVVTALANYLPSATAQPSIHSVTPLATMLHPPSFSAMEIHYIELVATTFRRMRAAVAHQPDLIISRFDVA
jgi:hypothetical protein